jgi:hypothetical protein
VYLYVRRQVWGFYVQCVSAQDRCVCVCLCEMYVYVHVYVHVCMCMLCVCVYMQMLAPIIRIEAEAQYMRV